MMKLGVWGETPFSVHCVGSATKREKESPRNEQKGADGRLLVSFEVVDWLHNHIDGCGICDSVNDFL